MCKHPIISICTASRVATSIVKASFEHIFRRDKLITNEEVPFVNFPPNEVIAYFLIDDSLRERNRYCHYDASAGSYVVASNRLVFLSISVKQSQPSKMELLLQMPIIYDLTAIARYPPSRLIGVFVNQYLRATYQ